MGDETKYDELASHLRSPVSKFKIIETNTGLVTTELTDKNSIDSLYLTVYDLLKLLKHKEEFDVEIK